LLDCAGIPVPSSVEGASVLQLARGKYGPDWRPYLHGEHTWLGQSMQWLTDGREKYCWMSGEGTEQLFDLCADPNETHDLARSETHGTRLSVWRERLVAELRGREEGYVDGDSLVPGRTPTYVLGRPDLRPTDPLGKAGR